MEKSLYSYLRPMHIGTNCASRLVRPERKLVVCHQEWQDLPLRVAAWLAEVQPFADYQGMIPATHVDAVRLQAALGKGFHVVEFEATTKTSADAAAAIGCSVAQIAKSILFKTAKGDRPVLVIASGVNRVDEKKISVLLGEKVKSADADYVLRTTGFAPGGVPPIGHATPPAAFIDEDLRLLGSLWAAGGSANAVFNVSFGQLVDLTGGIVADVAKRS